jgi:Leucine-rich repeat (LRR) protein
MPLETLRCDRTRITDLSPLTKIPTLRELVLPPKPVNIDLLRPLPLERLSQKTLAQRPAQTAQEFWREHDNP